MEDSRPKTFSWYGEMERNLTRDQLVEVVLHLVSELDAARNDVARLRKVVFATNG